MGCGRSVSMNSILSLSELKKEKELFFKLQKVLFKFSVNEEFKKEIKQYDYSKFEEFTDNLQVKYEKEIKETEINADDFKIFIKQTLTADIVKDHFKFKEYNIEKYFEEYLNKPFFCEKDSIFITVIFNNLKREIRVSQMGVVINFKMFNDIKPLSFKDLSIHLKYSSTLSPHLLCLDLNPSSLNEYNMNLLAQIIYCNFDLKSLILNFEILTYNDESMEHLIIPFSMLKSHPKLQILIMTSTFYSNSDNIVKVDELVKEEKPKHSLNPVGRNYFTHSVWTNYFIISLQQSSLEVIIINRINFSDDFWKRLVSSLSNKPLLKFMFINSNISREIIEDFVRLLVKHKSMIGIYFAGVSIDKEYYDFLYKIVVAGENKFKYFGFVNDVDF